MKTELAVEYQSSQKTAKKAGELLVAKKIGFMVPTGRHKQNLLVAFAKKGKVVYGRAFDIVKFTGDIDLSDLADVESNLDKITIFEIKSTRKKLTPNFDKYFFALTGAEVLVAQSLRKQFKFVLVNTLTGDHIELSLAEIFAKAKGIYPTWSICF